MPRNDGVSSYIEAIKWFKKSALQGHLEAMYSLVVFIYSANDGYYKCDLSYKSDKKAFKWLTKLTKADENQNKFKDDDLFYKDEAYFHLAEWYEKALNNFDSTSITDSSHCRKAMEHYQLALESERIIDKDKIKEAERGLQRCRKRLTK